MVSRIRRVVGSASRTDDATSSYDGLDHKHIASSDYDYDYDYVGPSELLTREDDSGSTTKRYDYDSAGRRQGQTLITSSSTNYRSYGTDAQGSVEQLIPGGERCAGARVPQPPTSFLSRGPPATHVVCAA